MSNSKKYTFVFYFNFYLTNVFPITNLAYGDSRDIESLMVNDFMIS